MTAERAHVDNLTNASKHMAKQIFATRETLARHLGVDVRSAAVTKRQPNAFLQQGSKFVPVYLVGTAGQAEMQADHKALEASHGLQRVVMARTLEDKWGHNWQSLCKGKEARPANTVTPAVAKKVATRMLDSAELNYASLVAPTPTNIVTTTGNGLF